MTADNKNNSLILWLIAICLTIGQLAAYIYVPSLPAIAKDLGVNAGDVQASVSIYLMSFGLSALVYGPLSDYFGRKPIFIVGGLILILGNILMVCSDSLTQVLIARFIQGAGTGAIPIFVRTVMRDRFSGQKLNEAMSVLSASMSITPAIAPLLGGFFQHYFNWRASFVFLIFYSALILIAAVFFVPETNLHRKEQVLRFLPIVKDFLSILSNMKFLRCSICALLAYSCSAFYLMISPFIFQVHLHVSVTTYGALMMLPVLGGLAGNLVSARLNQLWSVPKIMFLGIGIILASALCLIADLVFNFDSITVILLPIIITVFGGAIVFSNSLAGAMKPFPVIAGRAAALLSAIQIAGTGVVSAGISYFHITRLHGLGIGLLGCALAMLLIYSLLLRR